MNFSSILEQLSAFILKFVQVHLVSIIASATAMVLVVLLALWVGWLVRYVLSKRFGVRHNVTRWIVRTFRLTLVLVGALAILDMVGIDITSFIAALGIVGFAIAIGLRTTINNLFTGVMLLSLRPFVAGDYIEGERVKGVVDSVDIFSTVVVTPEGVFVSVPNGPMWSKSIKNLSRPRPQLIQSYAEVERSSLKGDPCPNLLDALRQLPDRRHGYKPFAVLEKITEESVHLRAGAWYEPETAIRAVCDVKKTVENQLCAAGCKIIRIGLEPRTKVENKKEQAPEPVSDDVL